MINCLICSWFRCFSGIYNIIRFGQTPLLRLVMCCSLHSSLLIRLKPADLLVVMISLIDWWKNVLSSWQRSTIHSSIHPYINSFIHHFIRSVPDKWSLFLYCFFSILFNAPSLFHLPQIYLQIRSMQWAFHSSHPSHFYVICAITILRHPFPEKTFLLSKFALFVFFNLLVTFFEYLHSFLLKISTNSENDILFREQKCLLFLI